MSATVLVVEDEREIRELLRRYLERAGYGVLTTGSGAEAVRLLADRGVDLTLLDLGLPDVDGDEVLREAHDRGGVPVVVLTARTSVEDRIHGLRLGADDYVTKPFSPTEVVLRVGAVLQRARGTAAGAAPLQSYGGGRLRVDEGRHEVVLEGAAVELTPTEWGLLTTLAAVPGRVYSRYELVNRVRGYEFAGYERTIDSHVKNLRHKLGARGPELVETVLGVGYRLGWSRDP
ncbi:response regulator transcription factor [Streptomyces sp. SLBN-31]|jgi:DNA-binding response OmpR family regulator|uniref:response regulator transcription factor n=1 Tax=Streptomyces sp. SLBN-31 TaxID=2768444 RepID=UPI001151E2AC|nr:response regulator transcription factor [Streptomyces sp. SLBN-31]TQJ92105.1 winged helix family two component transcriptional regulator [Streptomyces sp. SLBN-31]